MSISDTRQSRRQDTRSEIEHAFMDPDFLCLGEAKTDRSPVMVEHHKSILITGDTGAGKSTLLRGLSARLTMERHMALIGVDPHGMVGSLGPRLTALWTTKKQRIAGIQKVYNLLLWRQERFRIALQEGIVSDNSSWNPRLGDWVVLLADEIANLTTTLQAIDDKNKRNPQWESLVDMLAELISEGRKYGISIIATTLKLNNDMAGDGRITVGFPIKVLFRPSDANHAALSLGITNDNKNPELEPDKWAPVGSAATRDAFTRTIPYGLIRFTVRKWSAEDLTEASRRAFAAGIKVTSEEKLFAESENASWVPPTNEHTQPYRRAN
jgi:energy-coupling factor transporter ATP-binding protein EcfA2